jgi:hypothetical protein
MHVFKMAANFGEKRMSVTTMGAKTQAFATFPTTLVSHCPLPLNIEVSGFDILYIYISWCAGYCSRWVRHCSTVSKIF